MEERQVNTACEAADCPWAVAKFGLELDHICALSAAENSDVYTFTEEQWAAPAKYGEEGVNRRLRDCVAACESDETCVAVSLEQSAASNGVAGALVCKYHASCIAEPASFVPGSYFDIWQKPGASVQTDSPTAAVANDRTIDDDDPEAAATTATPTTATPTTKSGGGGGLQAVPYIFTACVFTAGGALYYFLYRRHMKKHAAGYGKPGGVLNGHVACATNMILR